MVEDMNNLPPEMGLKDVSTGKYSNGPGECFRNEADGFLHRRYDFVIRK